MKINTKKAPVHTHEGGRASHISPKEELRRSVLACLLWENTFYEGGVSVADRLKSLVQENDPEDVLALAIEAREEQHLRHVPLLLMRELVGLRLGSSAVGDTLARVIQRPDEIGEFLSLYWKDGKIPLAKQVKRGLAKAFEKFDEYQISKWNKDAKVRLRDALFLTHGKTKDCTPELSSRVEPAINKLNYKRGSVIRHMDSIVTKLVEKRLEIPNTWENRLSGGEDRKQAFTALLAENRLGYMALLRNLRNMTDVGVDRDLIGAKLLDGANHSRVLPFRYVAAARACPSMEPILDRAMGIALSGLPKLEGRTVILVDVSGSMIDRLSAKSELTRMDAASALAVLVRGISNDCRVFSFSLLLNEVPPRQGMALIDAIRRSQHHSGTYLGEALRALKALDIDADRVIVVTDEQSTDNVTVMPAKRGYMINVATNKRGVGYGAWTHVHGWSESIVRFIQALEAETED